MTTLMSAESQTAVPVVSIIVPCYNEQETIGLLLEAIRCQTCPAAAVEVVIADGLSSDDTRQRIADYQAAHPELAIRVVDNPQRHIPAGLNRAIQAARGETIIRLDAHSVPYPDYVANCLADLQSGKGDNVGGVWEIRPYAPNGRSPSLIARAIAAAAANPFGVGDALYRFTHQAQAVDTVPFGAFSRRLIERIGAYDESLLSNEDYEFNARLRQSGGIVWLDPAIRSVYFARPNLSALARQYARYGFWKVHMLERFPHSLRWRQALPPVFVISLCALAVLSLLSPFVPWLGLAPWLLGLEVAAYVMVLLVASLKPAVISREPLFVCGIPLAIAVMHLAWGSAFLWNVARIFSARMSRALGL
jgi:glycosyltransferase involved in cell wall biosynthesis